MIGVAIFDFRRTATFGPLVDSPTDMSRKQRSVSMGWRTHRELVPNRGYAGRVWLKVGEGHDPAEGDYDPSGE
jgi:hypothetical protein